MMIHVSRANKFFVNIPRSQFCESKPHLLPANKQGVEQAQQSGQKSLVTKLDDHKTELKHLGSVAFQIFMGLLTFPNGPTCCGALQWTNLQERVASKK